MKATLKPLFFVMMTFCAATASIASHAQAANAFAGRTNVTVSLKDTLTSKNAKEGQPIVATLEQPATIGTLVLPRGSQLLGHVVEVTKHSKDTPNGSVTIVFDQAKPKKADPTPIIASVYKIMLSIDAINAQKVDVTGGMRGSAADQANTPGIREAADANSRTINGSQSAAGAPVQVISAVPGVALSAVASDTKSGIMTAKNDDVNLVAGLNMVIGVGLKQ